MEKGECVQCVASVGVSRWVRLYHLSRHYSMGHNTYYYLVVVYKTRNELRWQTISLALRSTSLLLGVRVCLPNNCNHRNKQTNKQIVRQTNSRTNRRTDTQTKRVDNSSIIWEQGVREAKMG